MRTRSPQCLIALTASVIIVAAGCASDDSDSGDPGGSTASAYADALDQMPADMSTFEFHDVAAVESRLGIEDENDPDAYTKVIQEDESLTSTLLPHIATMSAGTWDATNIVWEVQAGTLPDSLGVRRLDDDVDLDAVIAEFEDAGYTGESAAGGTLLTAGLDEFAREDAALYVQLGLAQLVLPDEQLIVSAPTKEALAAYTEMDESLADVGTFDDLIGETAELEFVYAQSEPSACNPLANPGESGPDPDAIQEVLEPYADLGTPAGTALAIATGDDHPNATVRLAFDDADDAESDLDARTKLLEDGTSLATGEPFSTYLSVADATISDAVETIELDANGKPYRLMAMVTQGDAPFFACAPA